MVDGHEQLMFRKASIPVPRGQAAMLCGTLLLLLSLCAAGAADATTFSSGFKTLGVCLPEQRLLLQINIWYPSVRRASTLRYGDWQLQAARNGKAAEGRFPLILLSHASSETRFSHHETAAALAEAGFVVAAPTHPEDNMNEMRHPFTLRQLTQRAQQLSLLLNTLLTHPDIAASIDPSRIGILGFGAGATAALLLGGALPERQGWDTYCTRAGEQDAYCGHWAVPRMNMLMRSLPLSASLADVRIKAVAAVAPAYGMLFSSPQSMRFFYPPLLLVSAERDRVNRASLHVEPLAALLGTRARWERLEEADTASLASACPRALEQELPEMCCPGAGADRDATLPQLALSLSRFFVDTLGNPDKIVSLPAPPRPEALRTGNVPAAKQKKSGRRTGRKKRSGTLP